MQCNGGGVGSPLPRPMKLLSWNYQGLGNPWTVRNLRKLVKDQDPKVCFLMGTRLDKEGYDKHCREVPF